MLDMGFNLNWVLRGSGPMFIGDYMQEVECHPELDQNLLVTIVEAVEEEDLEQGANLSAAKKAEIIAMAYRHFAIDHEHDPELVARLFKLAS